MEYFITVMITIMVLRLLTLYFTSFCNALTWSCDYIYVYTHRIMQNTNYQNLNYPSAYYIIKRLLNTVVKNIREPNKKKRSGKIAFSQANNKV